MLEAEPDSDNIFENNAIDVFHPTRPDQLKDVCILSGGMSYSKVDCHGNGQYRKLNKPCLPNHKLYDPSKEDQQEDYYYCLLLLFVPFQNESDLLGKGVSAEEAFNHLISSTSCMGEHHKKLTKMLKAQTKVREINEHREATEEVCTKHDDADEPEGVHIAGEAAAAMNDVRDTNMCDGDNCDLEERIALLNSDQRRVYENISGHLNHQWQHEQGLCHYSDLKPLRSFYVYRKQFLHILAYAVTIHKCQGLSLNNAIIDLSNKVFSPGMAYVALSRVRLLTLTHLPLWSVTVPWKR